MAEGIGLEEPLTEDLNKGTFLLERMDDFLGLCEIPDCLAHLLHDLERVRRPDLLDEDVNRILPLCDELVEHLDVFFQELLLLLVRRWVSIVLDLLVLEVLDDPLHVGLLLELRGLAHAYDLIK